MEDAQFNQTCQIRRTDGRIEVRLDITRHLANLPRRSRATARDTYPQASSGLF
jgi:hypothetical protein